MLWDQFCLVEVCLIWEDDPLVWRKLCWSMAATVGFEQYRPVLETVLALLPPNSTVTLLADRGFEHGELMRWLQSNGWSWAIGEVRSASDLIDGMNRNVEPVATPEQAYLFPNVTVLAIFCHLATAKVPTANEGMAVLSDKAPSLQTRTLRQRRWD